MNKELSLEDARTLLSYDHKTGNLVWRKRSRCWFESDKGHMTWNARLAGKEAGTNSGDYCHVGILGKYYKKHRLCWFMYYGYWPTLIDHINRIKNDDRILNLRDVTKFENGQNRDEKSNSKSGFNNIEPRGRRFKASFQAFGVKKYLGTFPDMESALAAVREAKSHLGEFKS